MRCGFKPCLVAASVQALEHINTAEALQKSVSDCSLCMCTSRLAC
jgi:hypothetical protein